MPAGRDVIPACGFDGRRGLLAER